jgi:hypothetical protein
VGLFSSATPEGEPSRDAKEAERTLRVPALRVPRAVDDESRGFDYFATDLHHLSLALEIRRRFAERRGFLLLSGPPAPDGKRVRKYLDGAENREDRAAMRQRATLIECKPEWTFGDVIIACSRELGLGPDAGALSILSQVRREQRKGLMRMLVLENGDCLEDEGFHELRRFARVDGPPDVLPVVLLVSSHFAERLEAGLRNLKQEIVASLPMQRLLPGEVAAFIGYQVEPMGGRGSAAFAPDAIASIAEAADGDPRMVNRLLRQDLDLLSRSRGPTLAIPATPPQESKAPVVQVPAEVAEVAPSAEAPAAEPPRMAEIIPAERLRRRRMARLARGLAAAAALLVLGIYAGGFLYLMIPGAVTDGTAPSANPAMTAATRISPVPPPVVALKDRAAPSPAAPSSAEPVVVASSAPATPPAALVAPPQAEAASAAAAVTAVAVPEPAAPLPARSEAEPVVAGSSAAPSAPPSAPVALPEPATPPPAAETVGVAAAPATPAGSAAEAPARAPTPAPPSPAPTIAPQAPAQIAAVEPPASAAVAPPAAASPDAAAAREAVPLLARADQLLALGDMASAREFYELAADAGSAAASYKLGQTYDPLFLRRAALRGVAADPARAVTWYRRAAEGGSSEAAARLAELEGKDASATGADR